ncbi:MAG: ABC transporter ATP-binding protein, partial [Anaerolineae bacterium]|nr:ABC transporter ATP-binding protein [Anaerolineae bacterium]
MMRSGPSTGGSMGASVKVKARDFKGTLKRLFVYMRAYRAGLIVSLIFAAASTLATIFGPRVLGQATTTLFEGVLAQLNGSGGIDFARIGQFAGGALALYAISALFSYVQGWIMANVSTRITYQLRRDISEKMNRMPLKVFDGMPHGEVLSRITNDVDTVNQTLNQSLTQIITSLVSVVGVLLMMLSINGWMTLLALITVPLSLISAMLIIGRSQQFFKQQQETLGRVNGHIEEMYGGHVIVKAFNGQEKSLRQFEDSNQVLYETAWKSQSLSGMMMPVMSFIGNLSYVLVTIVGGWLAIRNAITVGDIQAFIQYVRSFTQPITQLANISNVLQQTAAAAERVFEFLDQPEESLDTAKPAQLVQAAGHVTFRNVQ